MVKKLLDLTPSERAFLQQVEFRLGVTKKEREEAAEDEIVQTVKGMQPHPIPDDKEREFVERCQKNEKRPPRVFECFAPYDPETLSIDEICMSTSSTVTTSAGEGRSSTTTTTTTQRSTTVTKTSSQKAISSLRFYEGRLEHILLEEQSWETPTDEDFSVVEEGVPPGSHVKSLVDNYNRRTGYDVPVRGRATCPPGSAALPGRFSTTADAPTARRTVHPNVKATSFGDALPPVAEDDDFGGDGSKIAEDMGLTGSAEEDKAARAIQARFRLKKGFAAPAAEPAAIKSSPAGAATPAPAAETFDFTGSEEEHNAAISIQRRFRRQKAFTSKNQEQDVSILSHGGSSASSSSASAEAASAPSSAASSPVEDGADRDGGASSASSSSSSSASASSASSSAASSPVSDLNLGDQTGISPIISPGENISASSADQTLISDLNSALNTDKDLRVSEFIKSAAGAAEQQTTRVSARASSSSVKRKSTTTARTLLACKVVLQQPFVTSDKKYLSGDFIPESYDSVVFESRSVNPATGEEEVDQCIYMVREAAQVIPLYTIAVDQTSKSEEISHLKCHNCKEKGVLTDSSWSVELEGWTLCDPCLASFVKFIPDYVQKKKVVPIGDMQPVAKKCPTHPSENLDLWCDECNRPVCQLCKVVGDHSVGEFKSHHLTNLSLKHHQTQMDIQRYSKTHFTFAKFQLQKSITTTAERISQVEENVEALLKMVRDQAKELEIQINKAANSGRNLLQSKRGLLENFHLQMDYAENYLKYISNPDVLDGGEFLAEVPEPHLQYVNELAGDIVGNSRYKFNMQEQLLPAMAIEGEPTIIERCKPKYIFKRAQKNVLATQNITNFLKKEVFKNKNSPLTPSMFTPAVGGGAPSVPSSAEQIKDTASVNPSPIEAMPPIDSATDSKPDAAPKPIVDAGEAPLSAWGREDSRPGARRLGRALMPYEIVEPSRQEVAFFGRGEDGQLPKSETTEHPAVKNFATKFESCASRTAGAGVGGAKTGGQTASPPKKMFAHYAAKRAPPSRAAFGGFAAAPAGGASVPAQADSDEEEEEAKVARRFSNLIGGRRSNKFMPKPRNEQEDADEARSDEDNETAEAEKPIDLFSRLSYGLKSPEKKSLSTRPAANRRRGRNLFAAEKGDNPLALVTAGEFEAPAGEVTPSSCRSGKQAEPTPKKEQPPKEGDFVLTIGSGDVTKSYKLHIVPRPDENPAIA